VTRHVVVEDPGPLTTVQDHGRSGQAAIGIGRSGACDRASYGLANRLLGNRPSAVALEVTYGGLVLRAEDEVTVVSTGARCPGAPHNGPVRLRAGAVLRLGVPVSGMRTYVAVRGGFAVDPVLGRVYAGDAVPAGERLLGTSAYGQAVPVGAGASTRRLLVTPEPRQVALAGENLQPHLTTVAAGGTVEVADNAVYPQSLTVTTTAPAGQPETELHLVAGFASLATLLWYVIQLGWHLYGASDE